MKLATCFIATTALCATPALAADLPVVAEPVNYVKVCDAYGAGYFQVPGKDTCLKIGSRIRAQIKSGNMMDNDNIADYDGDEADEYTYYTRGYLYLDSMTSTEWGMIATKVTMLYEWSEASEAKAKFDDTYIQFSNNNFSVLVGRKLSLFDGFIGYTPQGVVTRNFSEAYLQQANITLDFGSGVTVGMGIEDAQERGGPEDKIDFAGFAKFEQGWGSIRLAGGLHSIYGDDYEEDGVSINTVKKEIVDDTGLELEKQDDDFGYGVNATLEFNVPISEHETKLAFQAAYMDSAISYLGGSGAFTDGLETEATNDFRVALVDPLFDHFGFTGFALNAGLSHGLTETVTFSIDGSYAMIEGDISGTYDDAGSTVSAGLDAEMTRFAVDAGLAWEPAPGLVWSVSGGYSTVELEATVKDGALSATDSEDFDNFRIGSRIQYTF